MINENQEICKRIAEEIESYCENKMKRCPQCEKKIEWDEHKKYLKFSYLAAKQKKFYTKKILISEQIYCVQ